MGKIFKELLERKTGHLRNKTDWAHAYRAIGGGLPVQHKRDTPRATPTARRTSQAHIGKGSTWAT